MRFFRVIEDCVGHNKSRLYFLTFMAEVTTFFHEISLLCVFLCNKSNPTSKYTSNE